MKSPQKYSRITVNLQNMSDTLTPAQRHRNMAAIYSDSTRPELKLRHALWRLGFRYRMNDRKLPGKPDIVFPKYLLSSSSMGASGMVIRAASSTRCPRPILNFGQRRLPETRNAIKKSGEN